MKRLLLRLIAWAAPAADREWIAGDTLEELGHLEATRGAAAARRWLRGEAWRVLRLAIGCRLRGLAVLAAGLRRAPGLGPEGSPRRALRVLRSSPAIAAAVVASVALGVGANAAIYSLFDQFLWRPLPVPEPHRLVNVRSPGERRGSVSTDEAGGSDFVFSHPLFRDIERGAHLLSGVAGHRAAFVNIGFQGEAVPGTAVFVSGGYFPVLGLHAGHGRLLSSADDRAAGAGSAAVLSFRYWQRRFEGRRSVLGEALLVNKQPFTIVGVAPEGFSGTTMRGDPAVFVPITMYETVLRYGSLEDRLNHWLYVFGRLEPGATREAAGAALEPAYQAILREVEAPLQHGLSDEAMAAFESRRLVLDDGAWGQSTFRERARPPLLVLFGATGLVLLIACANVANLLLARGVGLSGELAVRASLGASRGRLVARLLVEAVALAGLGGLLGLAVARWTLDLFRALPGLRLEGAELQPSAFLFCSALALGAGILAGLFPAVEASRADVVAALRGVSRQGGGRAAARRFRGALVTAQLAVSLTLLGPAMLLSRSLAKLDAVDLGLSPDGVVTFGLGPSRNGYGPKEAIEVVGRVVDELRAHPGVESVGVAQFPVLSGGAWTNNLSIEGFEGTDEEPRAAANRIGAGFFETVRIPLRAGRDFTPGDSLGAPKVAIVDETFARRFGLWPDVLGSRISLGAGGELDIEIVGLAADARLQRPRDVPSPHTFFPYRQDANMGNAYVYARGRLSTAALIRAVPEIVARVDSNLPVENLRTLDSWIRETTRAEHAAATLAFSFAALATTLAALGLYGVLAYSVAQRRREIGVRMALGADAARVRGLVLGQVARMALAGGAIGCAAALAAGRLVESVLFGLRPHDPLSLLGAAALLGGVALIAGLVPARRACRVEPASALRAE